MGRCYLVSVGSYLLCGRYIVWVLIYRQQSANAAHRFFVNGNKSGVDSLDHFPSISPRFTTTRSVKVSERDVDTTETISSSRSKPPSDPSPVVVNSSLLLNHCHPNEFADFAAAISRASSGDATDPL